MKRMLLTGGSRGLGGGILGEAKARGYAVTVIGRSPVDGVDRFVACDLGDLRAVEPGGTGGTPGGPGMQPGDHGDVHVFGGHVDVFEAGGGSLGDQRPIDGLAKAFLPHPRVGPIGLPPPVEELLAGGRAAQPFGDHGRVRIGSDHERDGRVPERGFVAARGATGPHIG